MIVQGRGDVAEIEAQADLLEIAPVGAQQRRLAPGQAGVEHQAVEAVVLRRAADDVDEGVLQGVVELLQVDAEAFGVGEAVVVDPELAAVLTAQAERVLAVHPQAEVLQDRQQVRQRQRGVGVVDLAVQQRIVLQRRLVETHHQRPLGRQAEQVAQVDHRQVRFEAFAVARRKTAGEAGQQVGALGLAEAFHHQAGAFVLPAATGLDHLLLEPLRVDLYGLMRIDAQDELHPRQHRLGEPGPELAVAGRQALTQHPLDPQARLGGVDLARHVDQAVAEVPIGIAAQEQAQSVALLDLHDGHRGGAEILDRGLEQIVARQHLEHLLQAAPQVGERIESGALDHLVHLAAYAGNAPRALGIHRGGVQPHEAALAQQLAVGVELAQRHVVRVGRAMHPPRLVGLGERQQTGRAQPGQSLRRYPALRRRQLVAQAPRQSEQRGLVVDDQPAAVGLRLDLELLVAEEGEVVIQQPVEEAAHLGTILDVRRQAGRLQSRQQRVHPRAHRREVGHRQAHLAEHLAQRLDQHVLLAGTGAAVDFQADQRLAAGGFVQRPRREQLEQAALGVAAQAEHTALQAVDGMPAAAQLQLQRVDQEWHVGMQHLQHAVRRLPAIALVVGAEQVHLGDVRIEAPEHTPGRQAATGQIGQASLAQLVERHAGEELPGEQRHLRQACFADLALEQHLQLAVELVPVRCAEKGHGHAPLNEVIG
ncbi:hypothetical protein D3C78_585090 [compost metagenome]